MINTYPDQPEWVHAADLDGDGDNDVLALGRVPNNPSSYLLVWYQNGDGLGHFTNTFIVGTAAGFTRAEAADLDGDGDNDIVVRGSWYENQGGGAFAAATPIGSASYFAVADLDGDDDADILGGVDFPNVGSESGLRWFENQDGSGSFSAPIPIHSLSGSAVFAADLDGDGDRDVVAHVRVYVQPTIYEDKIVWHENTDGLGSFGPQLLVAGAGANTAGQFHVFAADVDRDLDLDVFSSGPNHDLRWHENLGQGTFRTFGAGVTIADHTLPYSVLAADLDRDGDADVVSADIWDEEVAWVQNGDGTGAACDNCPAVFNGDQADADLDGRGDACDNCVEVSNGDQADADLDGSGDVCDNCPAQANGNQADADLDGYGNLCDNCVIASNAAQSDGDVDGDGDACDNCPSDANASQANMDADGAGDACDCNPSNPHCTADCTDADTDGYCVIEDCNDGNSSCDADCADGDTDGFCAPYDCSDAIAHVSDQDGDDVPDSCDNCPDVANRDQLDFDSIGSQNVISTTAPGASAVFAADLDGDGDIDALSASNDSTLVAWYENLDGAGQFGPQIPITEDAPYAQSVFAADVDGDGDRDVFSASDHKLAWYENLDGDGDFGPQRLIPANADGESLFAADLDHDGDMDVVCGAWTRIAWFENLDGAGGSWSEADSLSGGSFDPTSVYVIDVDSDGDNDVVASELQDKVSWFENLDGAGTFGPKRVISTAADRPLSVFAADVDGDGDPDVLSASENDDKIAWYENADGAGGFGPQQVISTQAISATSVFAADVDGDGDLDVLSASEDDNKIAWYENTDGAGGFGLPQPITTHAEGASSVFAADVDNDGDPDVLAASAGDDTITWYETLGDGAGDACDCAPANSTTLPPPAVTGLSVDDFNGALLSWNPAPGANFYTVTRGVLSGISVGHYGGCLSQTAGVMFLDAEAPPIGDGFGYLVQGVSLSCGPGTLGFDSGGAERVNQDAGACP